MQWRYQERVLALAVFANFSQLWARLLISPIVPVVLVAFDVSKSLVGLALGLTVYGVRWYLWWYAPARPRES